MDINLGFILEKIVSLCFYLLIFYLSRWRSCSSISPFLGRLILELTYCKAAQMCIGHKKNYTIILLCYKQVLNWRTDILVAILKLLRFLNRTQLLQESQCQVWNRLDNSNMSKWTKRANRYWQTYGWTYPNYRKATLLKT